MNDRLRLRPDDTSPATRGELRVLEKRVDEIRTELDDLSLAIKRAKSETRAELDSTFEAVKRYVNSAIQPLQEGMAKLLRRHDEDAERQRIRDEERARAEQEQRDREKKIQEGVDTLLKQRGAAASIQQTQASTQQTETTTIDARINAPLQRKNLRIGMIITIGTFLLTLAGFAIKSWHDAGASAPTRQSAPK